MKKDPKKRYTAKQALGHEWITSLVEKDGDDEDLTEALQNFKTFRAEMKL